MSALDEPNFQPVLEASFEFPEGHTSEQVLAGHGMEVMMTASYLSSEEIVTCLLRLAETVTGAVIRERIEEGMEQDAALTSEVLEALVALNARIAVIGMLTEMKSVSTSTAGFGL